MSHSHGSGTKRVQCKYFLHGACGKGDSCHFSHDLGSSKPNMVCRFYQAGSCSYGSTCRYDHVKADQPPIQPSNPPTARPQGVSRLQSWSPPPVAAVEKKPTAPAQGRNANELLCPFAAAARCQRPNCPYLHGLVCPNCEKQCLHPTDTKAQEKHFAECGASRRRQRQVTTQQAEVSQGVECGICLEEVTADSRASAERRFGLLEGCNHAFCLECIRNWRQGGAADAEVVRSCPICRAVSYFVVPSSVWVDDPGAKTELIDNYKQGMGQKPCKHFDFGEGSCPFGSSCFYSHRYKDGRDEAVHGLRHVAGDDQTKVVDSIRLWDFLEASNSTQRR